MASDNSHGRQICTTELPQETVSTGTMSKVITRVRIEDDCIHLTHYRRYDFPTTHRDQGQYDIMDLRQDMCDYNKTLICIVQCKGINNNPGVSEVGQMPRTQTVAIPEIHFQNHWLACHMIQHDGRSARNNIVNVK